MEASAVAHWLVTFALKGSAILAGALLIAAIMRRAASATRHLVLASALLGLLLLPALSGLFPAWQISILPEIAAFESEAAPALIEESPNESAETDLSVGSNTYLNRAHERPEPREAEPASSAFVSETSAMQEETSAAGETAPAGKLSLDVRVLDQGD